MRPLYVNLFEALSLGLIDDDVRVYAKDAAGRYIYANHSFASDSGLPPELLLGATIRDTSFGLDADEITAIDKRVMETGTDTFRKLMLTTRRKRLLVYLRKCAIYDERMVCVGTAGIYRPVDTQPRRVCVDAQGAIVGLNLALSMLTPAQLREYEERMSQRDDEADELKLS